MSANFVAREIGWHMPDGWMQGENAAMAWFSLDPTEDCRAGLLLVRKIMGQTS